MHRRGLISTHMAERGTAPAPLMRALLTLCFIPGLANAIIDWIGPGGGRFEGGCRTGPPGSGGTGTFEELWAVPEVDCRSRCGSQSHCLAYEWVSLPQGYSRCELHRVEVTHALPVTGSVCFVKRLRTASSMHSVTTSNPANPTYQQTMAQPTPTIQPPWQPPQQGQQAFQRNPVFQQAPPPPPPHPCGSMLLPNAIVQSTPECMDLIDADLRYMDLSGTTFEIIDMTGADLRYANLAGATFSLSALANANFSHANLNKARIAGPTDLAGADFTFADLRGSTIADLLGMAGANFSYADMGAATLTELGDSIAPILDHVILTGATITGAVMSKASFVNTSFENAAISIFECDSCIFSPLTKFKGITGSEIAFDNSDLTGCDLSGLRIPLCSFDSAKLAGANFASSTFREGSFGMSTAPNANFAGATLAIVEFIMADLTGANFAGATLTESSFVEAKIDGADFTGAIDVHTVDFAATTGTPIGIPPSPPI